MLFAPYLQRRRGSLVPPISFVGRVDANTTTAAGVHASALAGDLGIWCAVDDGNALTFTGGVNGTPALAQAIDGTLISMLAGSKILTSTSDTGVISESVSRIRSLVFRGASGITASAQMTGTGTAITIPAATVASPNSAAVAIVGWSSNASITTDPSGMANLFTVPSPIGIAAFLSTGISAFAGDGLSISTSREWTAITLIIH